MEKRFAEYPVPIEADHPDLRAFFEYWLSLRNGTSPPRKSDFDPLDILKLLGNVFVVRVHYNTSSLRFQYTLWGTHLRDLVNREMSGKFVEEVIAAERVPEVEQAMTEVAVDRRSHFWYASLPVDEREFLYYRRLLLPFVNDSGEQVSHLIGLIVPGNVGPTRPGGPNAGGGADPSSP